MNDTDKTIPYEPSPAVLEYFRILRKKTNPCGSIQEGEEDNTAAKLNIWDSNLGEKNQIDEENIP